MSTELQTDRRGPTLLMTLSGPATRNALSPQVYAAGIETLNMAESNPDVSAVVLQGAGSHFCSGGDLTRLAHNRQHDIGLQAEQIGAFHDWIEALRSFPKPVIAAIEGQVAGGGVALSLACDLVVASESSRFTLAYGKLGLSPDGGTSWHLARALGRNRALALLWGQGTHTGAEWAAMGLAHKVVPAGQALNEALAWADELASMPAHTLASVKELVNDAGHTDLPAHLQAEQRHFIVNLSRPEAGEAIAHFLGRRAP
ncbi:oxepin-CoA hydrolase, alternative type [Aquabacterium sp.]|uniref:oxepin-CoA hydrolase, alternative type n=1 Tax=Aquabacterium sp. TaxID=1872578 RepID=UPI0025C5E8F6|nr:enoyl-CoA hydratase family protein [Aquabacterium sp.]